MKARWLLPILALTACASLLLAVTVGSTHIGAGKALGALISDQDPMVRQIILELRLPRALNAFCTGGLLALAGALMQVLLRNPLADPFVLGVSGGAAVAALAAMLAGLGGWMIDASAAGGAMTATLLVFGLSHGRGGWTPQRLLLTGVVVAAGAGAVVSLLLSLGEDTGLRGMLFWLMGDLSFASFSCTPPVVLLVVGVLAMAGARDLNVLARGDLAAQSLGVPLQPARIALFCATSALTAAAVTTAGSIGFIGLLTPHLVRLMSGSDHRTLVPASILLGGVLLTLADVLARVAAAPRQLPVGALTAIIGVPLFLFLMQRERRVS